MAPLISLRMSEDHVTFRLGGEVTIRKLSDAVRRARREGLRGVRSADAIHLGSADLQGCSRFFTYEKETTRRQWNDLIEATVSEPYTEAPRFDFR